MLRWAWRLLMIAGAAAAGCTRRPDPKAPERVTNVRVQVIEPAPAEDRLELPATVEAWAAVRLSAEVDGRIERIDRDEGETVAAGQVLFSIDSALLKAQKEQAEAALAAAKAEDEKARAGARPEELAIAEARVRAAQAAVKQADAGLAQARAAEENALRDLDRSKELFEQRVESQEKLDQAQTAFTIARQKREMAEEQRRGAAEELTAAEKQLALTRDGLRQEDRQAIAARVLQAKAACDLARLRFEKATVGSPVSGILNRRHVERGEYVGVGTPLADIVTIDRVKVVVAVPEKDIPVVRTGQDLTISFDALGLTRTGRVIFQSQAADPRTLTFGVKLEVANPDGRIRPGMIARVGLVRRQLPQAVTIPIFAVIRREAGYVAMVENGGTAHEVPLTLGFFDAEKVLVNEGLRAGDRLIVSGQRNLVDGDRVRVIDGPDTASPTRTGTSAP